MTYSINMKNSNTSIVLTPFRAFLCIILIVLPLQSHAQSLNFEHWSTRQIKESALFGGQTRTLYDLPAPWTTSNTHANVLGIEKGAVSVYPTEHNHGRACLLRIEQLEFSVMKVPVYAIATGSIFLGKTMEPVDMQGAREPMKALNMNYAYTSRPYMLHFDYATYIEQSTQIATANASKHIKYYEGKDAAEVCALLQRRWEDSEGRIHATRIATAWMRIYKSTNGWVDGFQLPFRYGDITQLPNYRAYEGLNARGFMAQNSKGKMVLVEEEGYDANAQPTHLILIFSSGCQKPFSGHVGNWMKVDNIYLR